MFTVNVQVRNFDFLFTLNLRFATFLYAVPYYILFPLNIFVLIHLQVLFILYYVGQ